MPMALAQRALTFLLHVVFVALVQSAESQIIQKFVL